MAKVVPDSNSDSDDDANMFDDESIGVLNKDKGFVYKEHKAKNTWQLKMMELYAAQFQQVDPYKVKYERMYEEAAELFTSLRSAWAVL